MPTLRRAALLLSLLPLLAVGSPVRAQATLAELYTAKASLASPTSALQPVLQRLLDDATKALEQKPLSVLDKKQGLVGVDPHAYVSYAPYFWPNPEKPDGLPFIRKDGKRNAAQVAMGDENNAGAIKRAACTLILADSFKSNPGYLKHAALLLRTWFLDPKTRMLPHLDNGQAIPGGVLGRKEGVIEWRDLTTLLLCLELLDKSPEWSADDQKAMRAWLADYYTWLTTSKIGVAEKKAGNNHGCWWDVQATALALYLGKPDDARKIAEEFKTKRIAEQIQPDGTMPRELERADSWGYSTFNLTAMCALADYAQQVGVDLWSYKTADGRSLRGALEYLLPFAEGSKPWPHENDPTHKVEGSKLVLPLLRASRAFNEPAYAKRAQALGAKTWDTLRDRLFIPLP
ncbi:alginate lyase family protein [Armatimonas rosea]|uniref:Alginate lyase domain-containing protein n=1 Tax=Armatimonas rosea TaxID=685828 RepID=A0A7W9ST91_ARMRO|nr:alginate lyase family protein [Armatimonas rosea]MBB6051613.1 hypothetical protein [Armatimonas rosea]